MYLKGSNILYAPVPKCACSSLKDFCAHVEYGTPFKDTEFAADGRKLHGVFRSVRFARLKGQGPETAWKFAVIRHPVDRIVSCYEQKVIDGAFAIEQVPEDELKKKGLSRKPSLAEFVERLSGYQSVSKIIKKHSLPLTYFLGEDPDFFDRIYNMSEITEAFSDINERAGTQVLPKRRNSSHKRVNAEDVNAEVCRMILEKYRTDIEIFGPYLGSSKFAVANDCAATIKRRPSWLRKSLNAVNRTLTSARLVTLTTARRR
ncbi:sulfotransferase family 2 domain-containing protein [Aliiroseovarius marinus]|uniref:sulfotransferase family 2 domain-containing protein n=1 Tax=Aliiroseovarius marinus TaxID=2500159 RepID=UPI001414F526|nr:sulfotransferase family 2 domain-containing protein [Aliiroseovarius marinus]